MLQTLTQAVSGLLAIDTPLLPRVTDFLIVGSTLIIAWALLRTIFFFVIFELYTLRGRLHSNWTESYQAARPGGKRILFIGDSTAYGRGADRPEDTIAGHFGHDFPGSEIINLAQNGAVTKGVLEQVRQAAGQHFDMVFIFTGGNDIWHFTNLARLEGELRQLVAEAGTLCNNRVFVFLYANFGYSPIFPPILSSLLERQTGRVRDVFYRVTRELNVPCLELYTTSANNVWTPFADKPERYFSRDYMHPSSEGYRLWYNRMWREMIERGYQFDDKTHATVPPPAPPTEA